MADWTVPLADVVVSESDLEEVIATYRSGWLSMGPRTQAFEAAFATYTGARHAFAVTNGTAALHLILLAAGIGPGDEVVVPSLTFVATANAVRYCGATPVFAEIAGVTEPWLSARAAEAALSERTRAILTVDYGGHPGEVLALAELAERRGVVLLEDAAHAAGSRLGGRHLGTFAAAAAFSFFSNKNLAVGEGGMVTTDDDEMAAHMKLMRSHGMTTLSWDRHKGHASGYDVVDAGFNYRIDEPRAALATARLARLDGENRQRRRHDDRYRSALADIARIEPTAAPPDSCEGAYHLFTAVLDPDVDRATFRAELAARGIQTSQHYPAIHRFSTYATGAPELPVTDAYATRTVTLPQFAHMTDAQHDAVLDAVRRAL